MYLNFESRNWKAELSSSEDIGQGHCANCRGRLSKESNSGRFRGHCIGRFHFYFERKTADGQAGSRSTTVASSAIQDCHTKELPGIKEPLELHSYSEPTELGLTTPISELPDPYQVIPEMPDIGMVYELESNMSFPEIPTPNEFNFTTEPCQDMGQLGSSNENYEGGSRLSSMTAPPMQRHTSHTASNSTDFRREQYTSATSPVSPITSCQESPYDLTKQYDLSPVHPSTPHQMCPTTSQAWGIGSSVSVPSQQHQHSSNQYTPSFNGNANHLAHPQVMMHSNFSENQSHGYYPPLSHTHSFSSEHHDQNISEAPSHSLVPTEQAWQGLEMHNTRSIPFDGISPAGETSSQMLMGLGSHIHSSEMPTLAPQNALPMYYSGSEAAMSLGHHMQHHATDYPDQYLPPEADVLLCPELQCNIKFTGRYAKGNLARHRRHKHGVIGDIPCRACSQVFQRSDAKRKHEFEKHGLEECRPTKRSRQT